MKIIKFDYWVTIDSRSDLQVLETHYINIFMFGFIWKEAIKWKKYTTDFGDM